MNLFLFTLILFVGSSVASYFLLRWIEILWKKLGLLDRPHLYKSERWRKPVPYSAGVCILLMLLIMSPIVFLYGDLSSLLLKRFFIVLIIGVCITIVSFLDDMDTIGKLPFSIPPIVRLLMQVLVGAIIGFTSIKISYISQFFGWVTRLDDLYITFTPSDWNWFLYNIHLLNYFQFPSVTIILYYFPLLVTIIWYVVVFNAVNFSDGIPGLTWGFSLITFIILGWLALKLYFTDITEASQENSRFLLMILAIIIPATYLLTRADIARRVIMWDSGTIMLAFLIATLSIIAGGKVATAISVLGIYLIDFVHVITSRILKGKNPMKWDQSMHLHFRLLELGLSQGQIRTIIYTLTAFFGISAIFLDTGGKIILIGFIAFVSIFLAEILAAIKK